MFSWILCASFAAPAMGQTPSSWISNMSEIWNNPVHWNNGVPNCDDPGIDAKHTTKLNHIQVDQDECCNSFEGKKGSADRFLLIEAGNELTVEEDLYRSGVLGANFLVKFQDGSSGDPTTLLVKGIDNAMEDNLRDVGLGPAAGHRADWVKLDVDGDIKDVSMTLGDDAVVVVGNDFPDRRGKVTGPGDGSVAWTIGNRGVVDIFDMVTGVDMSFGTSGAGETDTTDVWIYKVGDATNAITDTWTIRGYSEVEVEFRIDCSSAVPPLTSKVTVQDHATLLAGALFVESAEQPPITYGEWIVQDNAVVKTGLFGNGGIGHGDWTVRDSGLVNVLGGFFPDDLDVNGAEVECLTLGWSGTGKALIAWDLTIRSGGEVTVTGASGGASALHNGIVNGLSTNSTITYRGSGNTYTALGPIYIGGTIKAGGPFSSLTMSAEKGIEVASEFLLASGDTIDFDVEDVSLVLGSASHAPALEAFGPDYGLSTNDALFTDSPCVRRWEQATFDTSAAEATLKNVFASAPITCTGTSCTGDEIPEAVYLKNLVVTGSNGLDVSGLNLYYTGLLSASGPIKDGAGSYTPIKLTPTTYGDFDADGDGDETADVTRFNDAFPSELGDAEYDHLVDWNCDGAIDCDDRAQYITNWNPSGIEDNGC